MKRQALAFLTALALVAIAPSASAIHSPEHYSLFGNAGYVTPGNASDRAVHLVSSSATSTQFAGIDFPVEASTTFAELTTLSSDFRLEADDICVGGSPRYQIEVLLPSSTTTKNIFVYFGTDSGGAACVPGTWQNTGDVLETGRLLDTSQLGGTFYDPYVNALANYGSYEVVSIQIVTDSSWAAGDSEHAVDIDNTLINSTLFTYEIPVVVTPVPSSASECKKGGWQTLADNNGNAFKNQGDCVSFVATKGRNAGSGS